MANKVFSTKKKKKIEPQWMSVEAQGDYVEFYCCSYKYSIPSSGILKISSVANGEIFYVARKTGEEIGQVIGYYKSGNKYQRNLLMEYLADDPVLCEKLKNKEIDPTDLQKIADLYNPVKK